MKPLHGRLTEAAKQHRVPQEVVERDYALSYILAGLAGHPILSACLVFKGGTALKKTYFGEYRFSEDLDFSGVDLPPRESLEAAVREALGATGRLLSIHGPFASSLERYVERLPHPHGQEAFTIRLKFPWHPDLLCRTRIEITRDEPVLLVPAARPLLHGYGESLEAAVLSYRVDEIVAEKLRTLLQTQRKLATRGWSQHLARHYYDLWRVLGQYRTEVDAGQLPDLLRRKCVVRGVTYERTDDFFTLELVTEATSSWRTSLGPFVDPLPDVEAVLNELRSEVGILLDGSPRSVRPGDA